MQIFRSVTQHLTQHANPSVPKGFLQIANLKIGSFYIMPILYWLAIAAVLYVVSKRTTFGRHVFAVGSNIRTARLSGINVNKVKRRIYMLTGYAGGHRRHHPGLPHRLHGLRQRRQRL